MKRKIFVLIVAAGTVLALMAIFQPISSARALQCFDAQNQPVPCEKEKKKPTACVVTTWYRDADADGFGSSSASTTACEVPSGYAKAPATDCNDTNTSIHPGAVEICGDGIDQDCDGADAVCSPAPNPPAACTWPNCPPASDGLGFSPWLLGLGGLMIGFLIAFLLPRLGGFIGRGPRGGPGSKFLKGEMESAQADYFHKHLEGETGAQEAFLKGERPVTDDLASKFGKQDSAPYDVASKFGKTGKGDGISDYTVK